MSLRSKGGFTLIELLVAISIIAIVFGIIITSAGAIQKAGRDTQRKADLRSLQSALQNYYVDNNTYPVSLTPLTSPKPYISKIPVDPSSSNYCYAKFKNSSEAACGTADCHYYKLCANLENPGSDSCTCNNSTYNFQITPTN